MITIKMEDNLRDEMIERNQEAKETLRDNLMNEFESGTSNKDLLEEMFSGMSKEDILYFVLDLDYTTHEDFEDYKKLAFEEYCENRD